MSVYIHRLGLNVNIVIDRRIAKYPFKHCSITHTRSRASEIHTIPMESNTQKKKRDEYKIMILYASEIHKNFIF